jgi:hypothetical protein
MEKETKKLIRSEVCVACGNPLPTESSRMICKECEVKMKNESNREVR